MAQNKLTARAVMVKQAGRYGDGGGLWLVVSKTGAKKWVYRFSWQGKVTEAGLGSTDTVSLADARKLRDEARLTLVSGRNPIEARRTAAKSTPLFGEIADQLLEAKRPEWRSEKHAEQWAWSLNVACVSLRKLPVDKIATEHVLAVLRPLWNDKPETASRLRQRIEAVLNAAKARGFRTRENPAGWRGHLEHLLPKRQRLSKGHHKAMPYAELPDFMERLRQENYTGALALQFLILTAARSGEVFGARWDEIDKNSRVWIIPAHRMKTGREHRVPLSTAAMQVLETIEKIKQKEFIFPSPRGDQSLSHVTMQKVLSHMGADQATVHGFRSSFRDWAGQETHFDRELAEQSLAHRLGDAAELAYKRGDFLEKRRALMDAWAQWCGPKPVNVLKFKTK